MIVKMFQVDIQIDQEAHKIVLRNPAGQEFDITNCVQRHEVDIDGTAYLSVVATTRKCSYKAEPKETARTCSLHPDQPAVFRRGIQCRCGETVITPGALPVVQGSFERGSASRSFRPQLRGRLRVAQERPGSPGMGGAPATSGVENREVNIANLKSIQVGPYDYAVEIVDDLTNSDGNKLYGQVVYEDLIIKIDRKYLNSQRLPAIVWHEVLHAALELSGDQDNERIIAILGVLIPQLLADNQELRK